MENNFSGVTPVGRVISEAIFGPTMKGYQNKVLDKPLWYIQLAVPKTALGLQQLFDDCQGAAGAGFFNKEQERTDFAWKFKDGDAPDNAGRDGFAGCFIFAFRSGFAPIAIVDQNNKQILDKSRIIPGYQVQVAYNIKANGDANKPGIYLNFTYVRLISIDAPIISGPSVDEVFGKAPSANPMQPGAVVNPTGISTLPGHPDNPVATSQLMTPQYQPDPTFLKVPKP